MSNGISAHGITISRNEVDIEEVLDVTLPVLGRDSYERTVVSEGDDDYRVGIRTHGVLEFGVNLVESHLELFEAWADGQEDTYVVTFPDGATWEFLGKIIGLSVLANVDSGYTATVTVRPTEDVLFEGVLLLESLNVPGGGEGFLILESGGRIVLDG